MTEIRLAYASRSTVAADPDAMRSIERVSLRNNARLGITGALYFDRTQFFQVIEGPENAVAVLFDRIRKDKRHEHVDLVCRHPIAHRLFGLWSMKFVNGINAPQLRATFDAAAGGASPSAQSLDPRIEALQQA